MKKSKLFRALYLLVLCIFVISSAALAVQGLQARRASALYRQIGSGEEAAPRSPAGSPPAPAGPEPQVPEEAALSTQLRQLAEAYPDAAAWVQIPGTPVDYPVMRGQDNQYYLDHLPDGSRNALGSLFLDFRTTGEGAHLIVYGHNGAREKMFGALKHYQSQDYFDQHPAITYATPDAVYVCPIFSVRKVEAGGDAYVLEFADAEELSAYMEHAAAESLYPIDTDFSGAAGVLTLSTCTGWRSQRLVVQAVLPSG